MSATDTITGRIQSAADILDGTIRQLETAAATRDIPRDQVARAQAELREAQRRVFRAVAIVNEAPSAKDVPVRELKRKGITILDEAGADITPREEAAG